jgi:hypothetical protein
MKTLIPVVGGLSLLLAVPLLAADRPGITVGGCIPPTDGLYKATHADLRGKLERVVDRNSLLELASPRDRRLPMPMPEFLSHYWRITINGQEYRLDFGGNKELLALAEKLNGKLVHVTGSVEEILVPRYPPRGLEGTRLAIALPPLMVKFVHVKTMQPMNVESAREIVAVVAFAKLGYQGNQQDNGHYTDMKYNWEGYFVIIDGKTYRLDFGANPKLEQLALKLRRQAVVVIGQLQTGSQPSGGNPDNRFPWILVTDLQAAPVFGGRVQS